MGKRSKTTRPTEPATQTRSTRTRSSLPLARVRELETLIEALPDGIAVYDLEGHVVRSNAVYRDTLARFIPERPAETLRERVKQAPMLDAQEQPLPEEQWPQTRILRGEALAGSDAVEVMMYTTDGEALGMSVTGAPLRDDTGAIIGAVAVHRDITAQKRLEHELRQSRDELQAILEAVPDQVIVYDSDLHRVRSNAAHRAAEQRYYPGEQAPSELHERIRRTQTVFRDMNGAPLQAGEWPQRRILCGETFSGPSAVETQAYTPEGNAQWWSVSGAPLHAEDGTITGAVLVSADITQRKELEEALRRAHERFQLAERAANGFVYEWDVRAGVIYRSQGLERMLGYRAEDIPSSWEAWAQLVYPGDWQATTDAEELAYLEALPGDTLETEYRIRHRDGYFLTVADYAVIERDEHGEISRLIGQTHDITDRKRAEAALRKSERQIATIFAAVPFALTLTQPPDYRIVRVNDAFLRMFGFERDEVIGKTEVELGIMHDPAASERIAHMLQEQGTVRSFEHISYCKNGDLLHLSLNVDTIEIDDERYVLTTIEEITERKELEAELRASEERFRGIVETANEGVWLVDLLGRTIYANERMAALLGYRTVELTGRPITDFVFPEDVELARTLIGSNLQGNVEQFDFRFRRRDGDMVLVLAGTSPVRDATGETVGALGMFSDITERRRLEYEVAERASLLEAVFAAAPDRISIFDQMGQMIRLNPAAQSIAGPEREHASIETVSEVFDLRTLDGAPFPSEELPTARALRGEVVQGVEIIERDTDQDTDQRDHYILTSSAPFYDLTGELRGAVALAHDVTALRNAEREAATWAAQLDATFDSLTDGFFIFDGAGQLIRMNDAARRILALDAAPDYYSLTPEERAARLSVRDANDRPLKPEEWGLTKLAQGERLIDPVELRITALDGGTKDLAITGGPVCDAEGNVTGAVALLRDVTESRRLQHAVAEQASQLQATFDALAEPMCVFDARGRVLRQNNAERAMFGFDTPPATIEERAARIRLRAAEGLLLSPKELPGRKVLAGETLVGADMVETLALGADGHDHWFSVSGAPIRNNAGKIIGGVIVFRDVTVRRSLEREVEERAALLQTTFDAMTDGVLIVNADGTVRTCNDAYRTLMGYDPVTAERRLSADGRRKRFHARDAKGRPFPAESWPLTRILRGETITHESADDLYIRTRDGRKIIVNATGAPLRDADGALIGALLVMRDVTVQRALERETRWQAGMLERAHDAIFMWELDGPILYWNHGAELLYGYSSAEAVGQISHQLLQTERPVSPALFKKALKRNGEWIGDIRHTTRDGRRLVVGSRHQLLKEPGGRAYVLEVCRDITERLELEQELRRSHDELEQRVHERTRELASANRSPWLESFPLKSPSTRPGLTPG